MSHSGAGVVPAPLPLRGALEGSTQGAARARAAARDAHGRAAGRRVGAALPPALLAVAGPRPADRGDRHDDPGVRRPRAARLRVPRRSGVDHARVHRRLLDRRGDPAFQARLPGRLRPRRRDLRALPAAGDRADPAGRRVAGGGRALGAGGARRRARPARCSPPRIAARQGRLRARARLDRHARDHLLPDAARAPRRAPRRQRERRAHRGLPGGSRDLAAAVPRSGPALLRPGGPASIGHPTEEARCRPTSCSRA